MSAHHCISVEAVAHPTQSLPAWVPAGARLYLSHVTVGQSLRALGRNHGCHASTVLRQIRQFEDRRDDPLVDTALRRLDRALRNAPDLPQKMESRAMTAKSCSLKILPAECMQKAEVMGALRHLADPDTFLIVAEDMPKAAVTRNPAEGAPERLAVFDRSLAEAMALNGWITIRNRGRVSSYTISAAGRTALRHHSGRADIQVTALAQSGSLAPRRSRYGHVDSPVAVLARRRDKSGKPFLESANVQAADWLREDYVRAQLEEVEIETAQALLAALDTRTIPGSNLGLPGTKAARRRVSDVLRDLGPGLGDVTLRCCCRLEGVEAAEQALGWSARSGKIVLRIALQRVTRHYQRLGDEQMMIG